MQWQTMEEVNTDLFIVQRSSDGVSFTDMEFVKAIGNGNNGYGCIDASASNGVNYYRIKSIDKTGVIAYSKIVFVPAIG